MKPSRSPLFVPSLCLVLTVIAAVACKKAPSGPPPGGPVEVAVVMVKPEKIVLTTELPGKTSPYLVAEVRPQVNGLIRERAFEEGSNVKAGDLLYQIDPAQYQAAYSQAKAALAMAEANVPAAKLRAERLKGLVEIKATGRQNYDDALAALALAEASVEAARATAESARINLSYTPIRAPIPGRTGKSSVTVGALVTAYQPVPLAVVQQLDPIYVDVTQSSAELLRLRQGLESGRLKRSGESWSRVKLLLEDGTPYPLEGKLKFRDVTVDPTTGSVTLRMVFPNPGSVLLPGMFVRAVVEEGIADDAILVPQQGVTRDQKGNPFALLAGKEGKAEQRMLTLDRAIGDRWLVTKGLAAGDRVIVEGLQRIRPGADVKTVPLGAQGKDQQAPSKAEPVSGKADPASAKADPATAKVSAPAPPGAQPSAATGGQSPTEK
jgi:membrane fusion protein (multidrug efflux system)